MDHYAAGWPAGQTISAGYLIPRHRPSHPAAVAGPQEVLAGDLVPGVDQGADGGDRSGGAVLASDLSPAWTTAPAASGGPAGRFWPAGGIHAYGRMLDQLGS